MKIEVRVATILMKKAAPPLESRDFTVTVENGTDVETLIQVIGLPLRLVGSVTVNKRRAAFESILSEGDNVAIIPAISGG